MTAAEAPGTGRIVVGIDGSPSSLDALAWAARQADLTGSSLEIVMTWEWPSSYGWAVPVPNDFDPEEDVQKALEAAVAGVRAEYPSLSIDPRVVSGHPAPDPGRGLERRRPPRRREPWPRRVRRDAHRLGQRVLRHERALPGPRASGHRLDDGRTRSAASWSASTDPRPRDARSTGPSQRRSAPATPCVSCRAWMFPMALGYAFTTTVHEVRDVAQDSGRPRRGPRRRRGPRDHASPARPPSSRRHRHWSRRQRAPSCSSWARGASEVSRGSCWGR